MIKYCITIPLIFMVSLLFSQVAITIPGEYEKSDRLLVVWPYSPSIDSITAEITKYAVQHGDVDIIYNPYISTTDTSQIRAFLLNMGVSSNNFYFIPGITNNYFLRQYGPITGYGVFTDSLVKYIGNPGFSNYNQPLNDSIPIQLAKYWNIDFVDYGLQFECSNTQYDGLRYLFVGDKIIDDNIPMSETDIRFNLNAYFNSGEVLFIPSLVNSGGGGMKSIDNYIKLLDFETIVIASIPDSLPDYNNLELIADQLSSINNYFGYSFNIIRIPSPPNSNGRYPITIDEEIRSYTNSIIFNDLIIIPSFGLPDFDSIARTVYEEQMPGYYIHAVDARLLTTNNIGLHTITKEIPQNNYLRILHKKVTGLQEYSPSFKINCLVGSGDEVENMWLYYKINDDTSFTKKEIHMVCPQHFAKIEKLQPTDTVRYYIEAISSTTQTTYPLSAPNGFYTFWFDVVSNEPDKSSNQITRIAPNPSIGNFTILGDGYSNHSAQIKIYNSSGQLLISTKTYIGQINYFKDLLSKGYYTLNINHKGYISKHKLIITD